MNRKFSFKHSKAYDIQEFIEESRTYLFFLILGFYILSRAVSIVTVLVNYEQIKVIDFWVKIVFHSINMSTLLVALVVIKKGRQRVVIGVIIYNLIVNIIFNLLTAPDNFIITMLMILLQLIFLQMVFYMLFHDGKTSLIILLASIVFITLYYIMTGEFRLDYDKNFSRFLIIEILYGLVIVGAFLQVVNIEHHDYIRFIKGLLYIDYNVSLPNEKQLAQDFTSMTNDKEDGEITFIGLYIVNLLSLNRQIGYENVQKELLKRISEINEEIKEYSKLYKWEGPVFIFCSKQCNEKLDDTMNQLVTIFSRPVRYKENTISFKMNALGTKYPYDGTSIDKILDNLKTIKYSFLRDLNEKDKIYWFDSTLLDSSQRMLILEKDIHKAVNQEEIKIVIQPKISIKDKEKPFGGEVLARWKHPEYGFISPLEFIPLIEYEGLMDKFTDLIIRQTQSVFRTFEEESEGELELAINISASSLITGHINQVLMGDRISEAHNLDHKIELELTENILFDLNDESKRFISDLKKAGYKIAIDDFGTGFSNFEYLQELEIDILKIDKRFIDRMLYSEKSELVVNAIIKMAHTLGVEVVAEGVESMEQKNRLKELNCDYIQGFYYAKPMQPDEFLEFIKKEL